MKWSEDSLEAQKYCSVNKSSTCPARVGTSWTKTYVVELIGFEVGEMAHGLFQVMNEDGFRCFELDRNGLASWNSSQVENWEVLKSMVQAWKTDVQCENHQPDSVVDPTCPSIRSDGLARDLNYGPNDTLIDSQ